MPLPLCGGRNVLNDIEETLLAILELGSVIKQTIVIVKLKVAESSPVLQQHCLGKLLFSLPA